MALPTDAPLRAFAQPIARLLNLPHLPDHFPLLVYSFILFTSVHLVISPFLSARVFPISYGKLRSRRAVNQWNIQVVSLLHVIIIIPLALSCFPSDTLKADKLWGWDERVGRTLAVACGYFLWDALDALINFDDLGFLIHGVACLTLYMMAFRPFLGYYAPRFLTWELSTIFLNIHRFLDKTGYTGSTAQWVNGVILLSTFFSVRIVYGWYLTLDFIHSLYAARDVIPAVYLLAFAAGNLTLNGLNAIWFYKMIYAIRKRFDGDAKPLTAAPDAVPVSGAVDDSAR
ncbi:hypothetical protein BN946_scf184679.g11 [Trametes cinnabarina]|uniref:TLC domain-containing protein n=1 Tax=Pycnoporus cinnabarinus TaxID=5643 RepID=A0A060STR4_PYCCI|nr:hypothetical protein BN946_scf184679.g11 [Trametes cinnabarina]